MCLLPSTPALRSSAVKVPWSLWQPWHNRRPIATAPQSPKARDIASRGEVSLTYWDATHDTCTADCAASFETDVDARRATWDRFANGPAPVGYDPAIIPGWTSAEAETFGSLRLEPARLRVMPGSLMMAGQGELLTWRA